MPVLEMMATAAGPDFILLSGKRYNVSKPIYDKMTRGVPMQKWDEKLEKLVPVLTADGKPVFNGPFAKPYKMTGDPKRDKIEKLTAPDPEAVDISVDEDDDDLDE
jgi:hypothetical protein